jgi:hypothetical protein
LRLTKPDVYCKKNAPTELLISTVEKEIQTGEF